MSLWREGNSRCQAISASAGSGKTYRLTHRIIGLLANGVSPERITALTFSRKAAGEILDDVMNYLCQGAESAQGAQNHSAAAFCEASREDFLGMLRHMVDALPRLRIQTLDSFTIGTVRAFPFELGISGHFQVIDENQAVVSVIRDRVLRSLLSDSSSTASAFGRDFRQATAADEGKSIRQVIDGIVEAYHWAYIDLPRETCWGLPASVWGTEGIPYSPLEAAAAHARRLASEVSEAAIPCSDQLAKLAMELGALTYGGKASFSGRIPEQMLAAAPRLLQGEPLSLAFGKKTFTLPGELSQQFGLLLAHALFLDLKLAADRTHGVFGLVKTFEQEYDRLIRRRGTLTFTDAQLLLSHRNGESPIRLALDYRLDGKLDHWLLDEFQDTSDLQWSVMRNLVEEVLQDTSDNRSFFYVGDVKQAIYQWRHGNPRLFGRILDQWPTIRESRLPVCRRQPTSVIETVNRVFGNLPDAAIAGDRALPAATLAAWRREWVQHEVPPGTRAGFTALLTAPAGNYRRWHSDADQAPNRTRAGGPVEASPCSSPPARGLPLAAEKASQDDVLPLIVEILREVDPLGRGLTAAILVRSNATGKKVADFLRNHCPGLPVVMEGKRQFTDSMAVAVIMSMLRAAIHPGDTMAWGHLRFSPLWSDLEAAGLTRRDELTCRVLRDVYSRGFGDVIGEWAAVLESHLDEDGDFDRARLAELTSAASRFDALGDKSIGQFLTYVDSCQASETARQSAVRIMTVHQAKGLGFDVVILPELAAPRSISRCYDPAFLSCDERWILKTPQRDLAEVDPVIGAAFRRADAEACFENLCILYVAMTRARQAMYLLTPDIGGTSLSYKRLLEHQLAGAADGHLPLAAVQAALLYSAGDADWYRSTGRGPQPSRPAAYKSLEGTVVQKVSRRRKLERLTPSEVGTDDAAVSPIFSVKRHHSLLVGTAVHEVMAAISWLDETPVQEVLGASLAGRSGDIVARTREHVETAFASQEVRQLFTRPGPGTILWREKPFEAIVDGGWVSGVFDRVTYSQTAAGVSATIIDFKTDALSGATAAQLIDRHRAQLEIYRKVLAGMLSLAPEEVRCRLLFTANGTVASV